MLRASTQEGEAWQRAFSTLGCSGLPLSGVFRLARAGGWKGVELRTAPAEPVNLDLTSPERRRVRDAFARAGLTPLAIASYVEIDNADAADSAVVADVLRHARLAYDLGAPFVRVFPGGPSDDMAAARRLAAVARRLDQYPGVAVALETHDSCARGRDVARVLSHVGDKRIRAIWDVQHPWRAGETVAETIDALRPFIAYVQITDARSHDDPTPCLLGTGVLPLREAYDVLRAGYDGWISVEWASYWYDSAPPLDQALRTAQRWFAGTLWDVPPLAGPGPV